MKAVLATGVLCAFFLSVVSADAAIKCPDPRYYWNGSKCVLKGTVDPSKTGTKGNQMSKAKQKQSSDMRKKHNYVGHVTLLR